MPVVEGSCLGGCQKDRVAKRIVQEAEASGALQPGKPLTSSSASPHSPAAVQYQPLCVICCAGVGGTIVEGTSGSTGISLSLVGRSRGYKVLIVMPDDQAKEKV